MPCWLLLLIAPFDARCYAIADSAYCLRYAADTFYAIAVMPPLSLLLLPFRDYVDDFLMPAAMLCRHATITIDIAALHDAYAAAMLLRALRASLLM